MILNNNSTKLPDASFAVNLNRLPNSQGHTFVTDPGTGLLAPILVMEVSISHESMPILAETDLRSYFDVGTGTRHWVGIKVWKSRTGGPTRWWAGHASREMINGVFQNRAIIDPQSFPIVQTHNVEINIPTNIIFNINVRRLLHPCPIPAGYPATIDIDLEVMRGLIIRYIP